MTGRHGLRRFTNPENERSWIFVRLSGYGRISENIAYTAGFRSAIRPDFVRLSGGISGGYGRISFGYPAGFRVATAGKAPAKPYKNQTKA